MKPRHWYVRNIGLSCVTEANIQLITSVFTGNEKYYYIFARESYNVAHIPLGEYEVELYKGTNIIKKFDAADDAQHGFSIWN